MPLKRVFDSALSHNASSTLARGMFGMTQMRRPQDFVEESHRTISRCQSLVTRISSTPPSAASVIIKGMDTLSDMVCFVIDSAELIRHVHPDKQWVHAANESYAVLGNYISQLNTNQGLFQALEGALKHRSELSEESLAVAELFRTDFIKSGIQMPLESRREFVELNDRINHLGHEFSRGSSQGRIGAVVHVSDASKLKHMPENEWNKLKYRYTDGGMEIQLDSMEARRILLQYTRDHEIRRQILSQSHASQDRLVGMLEEMLVNRKRLANLLGHPSYSQLFTRDKMAKSPERVMDYLKNLSNENLPKAMSGIKQQSNGYYTSPAETEIKRYFSVGSVMEGIDRIIGQLYGLSLRLVTPAIGETWHPSVQRLDVYYQDSNRKLGTIYCDLYRRDGGESKFQMPSQFTVRCHRRIDNDAVGVFPDNHYGDLKYLGVNNTRGKTFQLPVVALVCDFPRPQNDRPTLLSWPQVETLFHEFGHAIHSMFAHTEYQHVSGTRCKIDFVETPSILMELISRDPWALSQYAIDDNDGSKLSYDQFSRYLQTHYPPNDPCAGQHQIFYAILDQVLHGEIDETDFDSSLIHRLVKQQYHHKPHSMHDLTSFNHLHSYGAGYYSYLWGRSIAERLYTKHFQTALQTQDPLRIREAGQLFADEILCHGGGRDPWSMRWHKLIGEGEIEQTLGLGQGQ